MLDIWKRTFAGSSANCASESGKLIGLAVAWLEMCTLKSSVWPSAVVTAFNLSATSDGLPSVESPSVMLITMGGKDP